MNRLGLTPREFYQLTPVEFDWALQDYNETQFTPMKRICEAVRVVAQTVHNSTPGRKRSDLIRDPKKIVSFGWETPQVQTAEEMKSYLMGLAHMSGVEVKQDGEKVDPFSKNQKMKRTK